MGPLAISLLLLVAGSFFLWTMWQRFGLLFKLKGDNRFDDPVARTDALVQFGFGQRRLLDEPVAGIMHVLIFAAFMVLAGREIQLAGMGFSKGFHLPLLGPGDALSGPYGLACNVTQVGAILGCGIAWYKRLFQKPDRLTLSWEAHFILGMITVLMLTDLFFDGSAMVIANQRESWRPVTSMAANLLEGLGLTSGALNAFGAFCYWPHEVTDPGLWQLPPLRQALPRHHRAPQRLLQAAHPQRAALEERPRGRAVWRWARPRTSLGSSCSTPTAAPSAAAARRTARPT